jgi:hypothetical protein
MPKISAILAWSNLAGVTSVTTHFAIVCGIDARFLVVDGIKLNQLKRQPQK